VSPWCTVVQDVDDPSCASGVSGGAAGDGPLSASAAADVDMDNFPVTSPITSALRRAMQQTLVQQGLGTPAGPGTSPGNSSQKRRGEEIVIIGVGRCRLTL
jgi:hypothetical protein